MINLEVYSIFFLIMGSFELKISEYDGMFRVRCF